MTISAGGSPSSSAVARCTASSVRIGSTGNGRLTRARIESVTATRKHRRSNRRSARTAARSWSVVSRAVVRARRIARAASAIVNAEVAVRPRARTDFSAPVSRSNSAATRALDSTYLTPMVSVPEAGVLALRFATVGVKQLGGGSGRKANVRPPFCRVAGFQRRTDHARRDELVEPASRAADV